MTEVTGASRRSIRAHLGAGGLAVAGIAGLGTIYLLPVVLFAPRAERHGALDVLLLLAVSLAFALAVWLLLYLPLSVIAEKVTLKASTRVWLPAALLAAGAGAAVLVLMNRIDQPPHLLARIMLLGAAILLGLGCALYTLIKQWLVNKAIKEQHLAP